MKKQNQIISISIPVGGDLDEWLLLQTNKSKSIAMAIQKYIDQHGMTDVSEEAYAFPNNKRIDQEFISVLLNKGTEMSIKEIETELIKQFDIPEFAQKLRYPKSNELIFPNKVRFSRLRLVNAGLIEQVQRSVVKLKL